MQSANLVHYSRYSEAELLPTAQLMLDYVRISSPTLLKAAGRPFAATARARAPVLAPQVRRQKGANAQT